MLVLVSSSLSPQSTGWTALFFAAEAGDVATMQSLIRAGANPLLKDKVSVTLHNDIILDTVAEMSTLVAKN